METHALIGPVVALVLWTLVVWLWMYVTRIPAMQKARVDPQSAARARSLGESLPPEVMYVSDNYNHLMEQPTIFYATAIALQLLGQTHEINITLAWVYVGLRVLHSLVQALGNIIMIRFTIFVISSIVLGMLVFHAAIGVGMVNVHFG